MNEYPSAQSESIAGQLNAGERAFIVKCLLEAEVKPRVALEVGTWLGGGSTLHILQALEKNGSGHLYGIEADSSIYEQMVANLRKAMPEAVQRFTPIFGFSDESIPKLLEQQPPGFAIDFVFLDGGNNPMEQIVEFRLLNPVIPVGGQLLGHDAFMRKGKFLVPYLQRLDNWKMELHDFSPLGLFSARKLRSSPSPASLQAAEAQLRRLRREPKEIAAAILPSRVCELILRALPRGLARSLSDGV